jgi:catechol 2,3-dioxygenase-like lactoylglutathione lyase family enzyme
MSRFTRIVPRLPTTDLIQTIEFYTSILGFTVGSIWPDDGPTFAILNRDDIDLQFSVTAAPATSDTTICIDVTDAVALHRALERKLPIEWGPEVYWYGRREFAIRDPNGYLVIFSEDSDEPVTSPETA